MSTSGKDTKIEFYDDVDKLLYEAYSKNIAILANAIKRIDDNIEELTAEISTYKLYSEQLNIGFNNLKTDLITVSLSEYKKMKSDKSAIKNIIKKKNDSIMHLLKLKKHNLKSLEEELKKIDMIIKKQLNHGKVLKYEKRYKRKNRK